MSGRRVLLPAALAALAIACSGGEPPDTMHVLSVQDGLVEGSFRREGEYAIELRVDPDVRADVRLGALGQEVESRLFGTNNELRVRGRVVRLSPVELRIGSRSYGPLKEECAIEIRADGVWIDGELRGELEP